MLFHCVQASELRAYIKSKGADISEENSEGGLHVDLAQIIEACDVCLKDDDKGTLSDDGGFLPYWPLPFNAMNPVIVLSQSACTKPETCYFFTQK